MKIRLSKKLALIIGGATILCGGSGAAAVFVGADRIMGPSYLEINGLECKAIQTVKMKKDQRIWVRKYVTSDEAGDGMARIRTALRVARAVQEKEKADIVQVSMVDKTGPTDRARMRGRTIGAQVVYIPDTAKAPDGSEAQTYSAYYLDGAVAANGEYYGMRIDLPLEDVERLTAKLTDKTDCAEPVVAVPDAAEHGDGGKKPKTHGSMEKKEHGEAKGEGASEHGEQPAAEGHGAAPTDGHGSEGHGDGAEVAAKESGGFLSSITSPLTSLFSGTKEETAPAGEHGSEGHGSASGSEHSAPAASHDAPAAADAHGEQKPAGEHLASEEHAAAEPAADHKKDAETAKGDGGFMSSVTSMIFGASDDKKPVAAESGDHAADTANAADGDHPADGDHGKDKAFSIKDIGHAEAAPAVAEPAGEPKTPTTPAPTDAAQAGPTKADTAGAAFLARMRGQPVPVEPPAPHGASDEHTAGKSPTPVQEAAADRNPAKAVTH